MMESWEYDRLISKALSAIEDLCSQLDHGESFESAAKRLGLSKNKVQKVYRARNRKLSSAVKDMYQSTLVPVNAEAAVRPKPKVRKLDLSVSGSKRKSRKYIDDLIKDIKEGRLQ